MEPVDPKSQTDPAPTGAEELSPLKAGLGSNRKESAWENLCSLLLVVACVFLFRAFVAEATVIPTGSMEQTILIGDHVFLNKLLYGPSLPYTPWRLPALRTVRRGDIVAFRYPQNPSVMFVKRVIAVGGDVVRVEKKRVTVNSEVLKEPYVQYQSPAVFPLRDNFPPSVAQIGTLPAAWGLDPVWARTMPNFIRDDGLHVPPGNLFVMGDNRDNSLDSRFWGFVPEANVVGRPLFIYWSYDAPKEAWTDSDLKTRLKYDWSILRNFFSRTRWSRMGTFF
jgi:signal peptidase I